MADTASQAPIKCVRIASNGEVNKVIKLYGTYNLPAAHPIFNSGDLSEVSKLVGMPLLVMKLRPSLLRTRVRNNRSVSMFNQSAYGYEFEGELYPNDIATMLMTSCNAADADKGLLQPPKAWEANVGSILVARADRKDLHPEQVERLVQYIVQTAVFDPEAAAEQGQQFTDQELVAKFTPDNYLAYQRGIGGVDPSFGSESGESMEWD